MWFRKKRSRQPDSTLEGEQPWLEKMAGPIARLGIKAQEVFAACMNRLAGKLTLNGLKAALVAFCIVCGGFSAYLVIAAIIVPNEGIAPLKVETLRTPIHLSESREERVLRNSTADARVARKIRAFRQYMDSLRKVGGGLYDSIRARRPGLIDSLTRVENWYGSQPLK